MILDHTADLPYNLSASLFRREVVQKVLDEAPLMVCNPDFGVEIFLSFYRRPLYATVSFRTL